MKETDPEKYAALLTVAVTAQNNPTATPYREIFAEAGDLYGKDILRTPIGKYYKNVIQE